jgi:hypothetical protein
MAITTEDKKPEQKRTGGQTKRPMLGIMNLAEREKNACAAVI